VCHFQFVFRESVDNLSVKVCVNHMDILARFSIPNYEFVLVFGRTKIDYDLDKEDINCRSHGYSLESAMHLLERIILPMGGQLPYAISDAFEEKNEVRYMLMSVDDCGDVVLMVTTMRPDETVRVISYRRAHEKEREKFKELTGYVESNR